MRERIRILRGSMRYVYTMLTAGSARGPSKLRYDCSLSGNTTAHVYNRWGHNWVKGGEMLYKGNTEGKTD